MGRGAKKRQQWYEQGVSALACVTDGEVEGYACPLCRRLITDVEELTLEHAPPRSLGGKEVALTCEPCNAHGSRLDAAMRKAEDILDWGLGTSQKPIRARGQVLGVTVNVETERRDGGAISIVGLPKNNHPEVNKRHLAALEEMTTLPVSKQGFTMSFPQHRVVTSDVHTGWLRAAYLAAFSRFGYRYALRPLMEPVLAQIADPAGGHLDRYILHGSASPPERRMIIAVQQPRSLRSFAVVIGRHLIFLPGYQADSDTLYERLDARAHWPLQQRSLKPLDGPNYSWPTRPVLALDFT